MQFFFPDSSEPHNGGGVTFWVLILEKNGQTVNIKGKGRLPQPFISKLFLFDFVYLNDYLFVQWTSRYILNIWNIRVAEGRSHP
jgi:hypothetical protein